MKKVASFGESDKALIDDIKEYQKAHNLPSFSDAVKKLCNLALDFEKSDLKEELFILRKVLGISLNNF